MKITAIKQQVKRAGRYSIFIDEKYSFSLSELSLINSGLRIGRELNDNELAELKDTSRFDTAYNQVLGLLARRARSCWEVEQYLTRKEYEKELQEQILNKLRDYGYVDDLSFARAWVENRRLLKSISKRRLLQELKLKRISDEVISEVLREDETDELAVLHDLITRKRRQAKYQDDIKLMQYLIRQGYSYGDIKSALSVVKEY